MIFALKLKENEGLNGRAIPLKIKRRRLCFTRPVKAEGHQLTLIQSGVALNSAFDP